MWKGLTDNKKAKRLSKGEIKKKLLDSMTIDEIVGFDDPKQSSRKNANS